MGRQALECTKTSTTNSSAIENMLVQSQSPDMRVITLYGDVNEQSVSTAIEKLIWLDSQSHKDIHLVLSTYGGVLHDMLALYDTCMLLRSHGTQVCTVGIGKIMSAGVLLLATGAAGKRLIGRTTTVMMHGASGGTVGNVFEMINEVTEAKRINDLMVDLLAENSKMSKQYILDMFDKKIDQYIDAQKAIELGIADKIIG
jgi:ATP-dependent Clp protease protease subunit